MWNSADMCLDKKYWSARHTDEESTEYERSTRVAISTKYTVLKGNDGMTCILFSSDTSSFYRLPLSLKVYMLMNKSIFHNIFTHTHTHTSAPQTPKTPWSISCQNPVFNPYSRHHIEIQRAMKNRWKQNVQIQLSMQHKTDETQLIKIRQIM